jgi:sortase A
MTQNIRRNKDAAFFPPGYGIFSGDIPTDPTSLYHDNAMPYNGYTSNVAEDGYWDDSASDSNDLRGSFSPITGSDYGSFLPPTSISSMSSDISNTQTAYNDDGSIGTLTIPALDLTVKVYEGETQESMKNGLGHFEFSPMWDGNVVIAGHNRGVPVAIGGVKDLKNGDEIIYTTKHGTRTYAVYNRTQISDTDYALLGWTDTNIITIITCVQDVPNMRWCVQAKEK